MTHHITYVLAITAMIIGTSCASQPKPWNINAQPYDATNQCWKPSQVVGQTTAKACSTIAITSMDDKGTYWRHGGCYPKNFSPSKQVPKEIQDAPSCPKK